MDEIDRQLISALQENGRKSFAELARYVGLSAPAVHDRVSKLETSRIITGYHADIDQNALGFGVTALIGILPSTSGEDSDVATQLAALDEVDSIWCLAGEESYMLLVRVADIAELEHTIGRVHRIPGVARTRTNVILSTKKRQGRTP
ncbi:MAG: Lrp/AsnC family transcriptional regulator [Corynebacteriales bacterium]|nr:Lrp/AsnC family transcriptional regulator [Mycobacteriales bacterium]